jgi:NAD(P)-dependent dehydrogenase (short-subunit alcohol dehydrogenase family)
MELSATGLRVIVTAAGSSIGRVIAEIFHEHGAQVHVCDVVEEYLADIRAKSPGIGATLADVGKPDDVDRLFDEALDRLGGLDVLVNNDGIGGPTASVEDLDPKDWDRVMAVNISGQFYCVRRAVPMRVAYAVSKHAVMGLTETLARELGPAGIRVNTILPGWMNNERNRRVVAAKSEALGITPEEYKEQGLKFVSLRTMIEPVEIAHAALFLCSPAGHHISGQAIGVCGNVEYER